jgi:2-keto-4-pentenoate hydratase
MTSDAEAISSAAARLIAAAATGEPCAPVRDLIGSDDAETAYAVQRLVVSNRIAGGATVVGRKIGLTSKAVREQLGVDQPDFGVLFDDMGFVDGDTVPINRVLQPRVEAEVAFVLGEDLADGPLDVAQVRTATAYVVPALEICGSRVRDWDITFGDTVADNGSAGLYVLGPHRRNLADVEPADVEMRMIVSGQEDSTGRGAACLGNPLVAVQWLARRARDLGDPLRSGQVILSGALGPMRQVVPGATASAKITGLGAVTAHFSDVPEE